MILVNENTRLVVQGITGREGTFHAERCKAYGTNLVAGVTPGRGGAFWEDTVPVFDSMAEAVRDARANTSLIFVPAAGAADAILEAADAGIKVIACITEGLPVQDSIKVVAHLEGSGVHLIGPNCPGLISPGANCKVGIMPGDIHTSGNVGVISRSGTLTYEAVAQLTEAGIGQSTCVGIGGDPVTGTSFTDALKLFNEDPDTHAVVMIGEIGGTREQEAADYIKSEFKKPIVAMIAGSTAPAGKRMGHAGAIITGAAATASAKVEALKAAGATIAPSAAEIGSTMSKVLS
jgi:succinyl-CoA synthetase alpha subunit